MSKIAAIVSFLTMLCLGGATVVLVTPGASANSRPCPGNSCHGSTTTPGTTTTTTSTTTTTPTTTTTATATATTTTTTTTSTSSPSYKIPSSIPGDCSVDVTQQILSWIGSVPDNAVLNFGQDACYRIEGTLEFSGRNGLDFEGNGSTFGSFNAPTDQRAIWRAVGSTSITFRNMTIQGSYANGGTFTATLQHAHAIDLRGTSVTVANVSMSDLAGDCVYFGLGSDRVTQSSGSLRDSSCTGTGRNAVSVVAGHNITVQRVTTNLIGYDVFDIEPNAVAYNGADSVTFDSNIVGSYALNAYSIVPNAPVSNVTFSNNAAQRTKFASASLAIRPQNVTVTNNTSVSNGTASFYNMDNLTVSGNTNVTVTTTNCATA